AQRRDQEVRLRAQPILDLTDRRQTKAIPVLHGAAARREQFADEAVRSRLTDVLGFDADGGAAHARADLVPLAAAEETAMQERRVRDAERVLEHGVQRRRRLELTHPDGVPGELVEPEPERLTDGLLVECAIDPHEPLLFTHGRARTAALARRT